MWPSDSWGKEEEEEEKEIKLNTTLIKVILKEIFCLKKNTNDLRSNVFIAIPYSPFVHRVSVYIVITLSLTTLCEPQNQQTGPNNRMMWKQLHG